MAYILILVTNLVLMHLFNPVITSPIIDSQVMQAEDVISAQSPASLLPFREYKDQGLIGPEGGLVYIENDNGAEIAYVSLEPGFLREQVVVTLHEKPYEAPPGRYDYLKWYEDEIVTQVGPQVRVIFPYSAINMTSTAEIVLFIYPYEDVYERSAQNLYEVQTAIGGGQFLFTRRLHDFERVPEGWMGRSIFIPGAIYGIPPFSDNPPETYEMIAQPLTITRPPRD
ncbi:MAG: hypothetical protein AAF708_03035 [Deinococcota bacterium]